jgi:hypothetical protein
MELVDALFALLAIWAIYLTRLQVFPSKKICAMHNSRTAMP